MTSWYTLLLLLPAQQLLIRMRLIYALFSLPVDLPKVTMVKTHHQLCGPSSAISSFKANLYRLYRDVCARLHQEG
jgi:hypothetical protein